ncbi:MAG TPA: phage baseplate assembly protein V, partial [Mucilaginibacter sp.]|nr:phage baseplate assembly protein V [Mucilaginibacter sp.]
DGKGKPTGSADLSHAISAANQTFSKSFNQPTPIRIDSQKDIDSYVENEQKALISDLIKVNGSGDEPQVTLGCIVDVSMSVRGQYDFTVQDFGKFLITSIFHHVDGLGHYHNTFEGVAADTECLPVYHAVKPAPDIQIATVLDNDDPDKKSRIKVKFKWEAANNDPTEWLRIISPSAGSDDQGGGNRGFVSIPEKNDQVLIAFEEGNIARPVVMGSVYHNNNGNSSKQQDNHIKSLSTRSGHLIQFDDSSNTQGIIITDRNGNVINIDTQGNNITITAVETLTLNAKNMKINVQEDMETTVKQNMKINVQQKIDIKAADMAIDASNTLEAKGESSVKVEGAQVEITGSASTKVSGAQLDLEGSGMANLKAPLVKIN